MTRNKRNNRPGFGPEYDVEGMLGRLLHTAFRKEGARPEFRDRLIQTSLGILAELLGRRSHHETADRYANPIPTNVASRFERGVSTADHTNSMGRPDVGFEEPEEEERTEEMEQRRVRSHRGQG